MVLSVVKGAAWLHRMSQRSNRVPPDLLLSAFFSPHPPNRSHAETMSVNMFFARQSTAAAASLAQSAARSRNQSALEIKLAPARMRAASYTERGPAWFGSGGTPVSNMNRSLHGALRFRQGADLA